MNQAPAAAPRERPPRAAGMPPDARPQRRLNALQTAAATAVIVASLGALGMMTGVLPSPLRAPPAAVAGPVKAAPVAGSRRAPDIPIAVVEVADAAARPAPESTAPGVPEAAAPPASHAEAGPAVADVPAALPPVASAPARQKRHRRTQPQPHPARASASGGKTREQVMAELLQSKRDGTYPGSSETYR